MTNHQQHRCYRKIQPDFAVIAYNDGRPTVEADYASMLEAMDAGVLGDPTGDREPDRLLPTKETTHVSR